MMGARLGLGFSQPVGGGGAAPVITVPAAPTLTLTPAAQQLTVGIADGSNGGSAITGHTLWLSTTNGFTPGAGNLYGAVSNGTVITGLESNKSYYGILIATNAIGNSANSAQATATTPVAALPQSGSIFMQFSADAITPQTDNTGIAAWTDSIGGSVQATQGTGANQPKYRTNVLNGKPAVQMQGSQWLTLGRPANLMSAITGTNFSMMIVTSNVLTPASTLFASIFGSSDNQLQFFLTSTTAGYGGTGLAAQVPYSGAGNGLTVLFLSNQERTVLGSPYKLAFAGINGTSTEAGSGGVLSNGAGTYNIGAHQNASTYTVKANLYEIIFWTAGLTMPEIIQATNWAFDKYGQSRPMDQLTDYIIYAGDSITQGLNAAEAQYTYPYLSAAALSRPLGTWTNIGRQGATINQLNVTHQLDVDLMPAQMPTKTLKMPVFEWYNQAAVSPATTPINNSLAYLAARKAANPNIKIAWGTSTDANGAGGPTQSGRAAYNAYFDANHTLNIDSYVQIHLDANIGAAGTSDNTTYFQVDKIHLKGVAGFPGTQSGYPVLAGLMTTGIQAL